MITSLLFAGAATLFVCWLLGSYVAGDGPRWLPVLVIAAVLSWFWHGLAEQRDPPIAAFSLASAILPPLAVIAGHWFGLRERAAILRRSTPSEHPGK